MATRTVRLHSAKSLTLSRCWANGYHGQPIAFVDQSVIFYAVDDGLRFHDFTDQYGSKIQTMSMNGLGVGVIAGNADMHLYAFTDFQSPPCIHLHEYPSLNEIKQFKNGAELEYRALAFSTTDELLSLSSAPDYLLTIWNWRTGTRLAQCRTTEKDVVEISFNPNSWYDIGILYSDQINFYTCERKNEKYSLFERQLPLELFNQTVAHNQPIFQQTKLNSSNTAGGVADALRTYPSRFSFALDNNVVGNDNGTTIKLVAFDAENEGALETYIDDKVPLIGTSFCWGDKGYIFVGTLDNSLIQIFLQFDRDTQPFRTFRFTDEDSVSMFDKMILHKHGLFCAGSDNIVRLISLSQSDGTSPEANSIKDIFESNTELVSIAFNTNYNNLFICSNQGIDMFSIVSTERKETTIVPSSSGKIVGITMVNPDNDFLVTARDSGTLEAWSIVDGSRKFSIDVEGQSVSNIICNPLLPLLVVTTKTGYLYFYQFNDRGFRLVHRIRLHTNDVRFIKFNVRGRLLISIGSDNNLFMMDIRTDQSTLENIFQVIYRTELDGDTLAFDLDDYDRNRMSQDDQDETNDPSNKDKGPETRLVIALNLKTEKFVRFLIFDFDWLQYREHRTTTFGTDYLINDASNRILTKTMFVLHEMIEDFVITARNQLITIAGKMLRMCRIPDEAGKNEKNDRKNRRNAGKLTSVEAQDSLAGLTSPGGNLYKNQSVPSWVLAVSRQGILSMIRASDMAVESSMVVHSVLTGGCRKSTWTVDSKYFASVADDDSIVVFQTSYAGRLASRVTMAPEEFNLKISNLSGLPTYNFLPSAVFREIQDRFRNYEMKFLNAKLKPPSPPNLDASWAELKEYEATLDHLDAHLASKLEINNELDHIRNELQKLMAVNEEREEKARLDRREFDLDSEEQDRQRKEREAMISKKRDETITENLIRLMKREIIKQQCWDSMAVKGRCLESITNPQRKQAAPTIVENYPLLSRSLEELETIRQIGERRRIEIGEKKLRRQILSNSSFSSDADTSTVTPEDQTMIENDENSRNANKQSVALLGSVSHEFQVDTSLLYEQFEIFTDEQKWTQIALLNDLIFKIKEAFNKEFESVYQKKLQELAKIRERNTRIKQIHADLDDATPVWEPDLTEKEKPQLLFEVKDSEVKAERYYTAEQLKQLEEQRLNEERRREQEKLDNWRERGLNDMMGGVLQVRREDELKKEIPKPQFVLEKEEEEWNDVEKQVYQQYLQKVKEQQEERDKLRKLLTGEETKINEQIQESCLNFEQILVQLHRRRILAQTAITQEELKISRLVFALVKDRLIDQFEESYSNRSKILEVKIRELEASKRSIEDAINNVDNEKRRLKGDDNFEKQFPREFADVPTALQDALKRLLARRARMRPTRTTEDDLNPYSGRQLRLLELEMDKVLAEADAFSNAPPNIVRAVWDRFVEFRKKRNELDRELRLQEQEELVIKNLKSIRESEFIRKTADSERLETLLTKMRNSHTDDLSDLYIQLVLKQGQIEMEPQPADNSPSQYRNTNVELIHRREVESLNKSIVELANQKIRHMEKCKHVCNDLHSMEWEKEKLTYEIVDLKQRAQDITFLKVTRNVQEYLACSNDKAFEEQKQREAQMLERTISKMRERFEEQQNKKEDEIGKLQQDNLSLAGVTLAVDDALKDANVNVYERKNIIDQQIIAQSKAEQQDRMRQIVRRRRLVDLAKAQAQEVAYLRAEVERLRMKTFPALVQIEH